MMHRRGRAGGAWLVASRWRSTWIMLLLLAWLPACAVQAQAEAKSQTIHFRQTPEIAWLELTSEFFGYQSAIDRDLTSGELAYDYSVHLLKDGPLYRLYCGGRWLDRAKNPPWDGDHVLQFTSPTGQGGTWAMPHARPEFPQGQAEGYPGTWFSQNYLEPEVLKVNGVYYMYTQVQVDPGTPVDQPPGTLATTGADRIQLHTSADGHNWRRFSTERGVVVNIPKPASTALHHQEVVYVPWDRNRRPWWMYVAYNEDGIFKGYWRIRSSDPTRYDFSLRQAAGLAQLGNQIGYIRQAPGGPLFVRITFVDDGAGRHVPSLQFSRDGLTWFWGEEGPVLLAGSDDDRYNKNCYFLGLSTIDGTGELEYAGSNTWRAIYGATTSNTPVAPEIFRAEVGVGELTLRLPGINRAGPASWVGLP